VFDDHGEQRNTDGEIVSQEISLSTTAEITSFSPVPLTKEILEMKELGDALDAATKGYDYSIVPLTLGDSLVAGPSSSVASTRGSDLPTPVGKQADRSSPKMSDIDESSGCGASLMLVDSATTVESAVSNHSSFDEVDPMDVDDVSDDAATHAPSRNLTGGFKQKVRRSLEWWSGSGF